MGFNCRVGAIRLLSTPLNTRQNNNTSLAKRNKFSRNGAFHQLQKGIYYLVFRDHLTKSCFGRVYSIDKLLFNVSEGIIMSFNNKVIIVEIHPEEKAGYGKVANIKFDPIVLYSICSIKFI